MIKVYFADTIPDAHFASNLLKSNGIENKVINENIVAAYGEVPPSMDTFPTVCILDENKYNEAIKILTENIKGFKTPEEYKSIVEIGVNYVMRNPMQIVVAIIIIVLVVLILESSMN